MRHRIELAVVLPLAGVLAVAVSAAWAQHPGHGAAPAGTTKKAAVSTKEFVAANDRMHRDMNIKFSGDADVDFVRGMIPHHQGAIDMAKVVLAHGKDGAIRKLAEDVIKAQEAEIAMMKDWLTKNAPAGTKKAK
jgi:uncharacterized protein (DUF305 family)